MGHLRCLRAVCLAALGVPLLAGCFEAAPSVGEPIAVVPLRIDAPVHAPVWSGGAGAVLALTADGRVVRINAVGGTAPSPSSVRIAMSAPIPGAGENLVTDPDDDDRAFVPQPDAAKVAVVDVHSLREVGTLLAGPSPAYLATDDGSKLLLALSKDRSTVTPVRLPANTELAAQHVSAQPSAEIEGARRGSYVEYHVVGPNGVRHYQGGVGSGVGVKGSFDANVQAATGDKFKVTRLYLAEKGTNRLVAVDSKRWGDGMEQVGAADLGAPAMFVGSDFTRVYAVTDDQLVVLRANSFEGYRDGRIADRIDFRAKLPTPLKSAQVSGMAVGPSRVYLTFKDQPWVVSIAEPTL